MKKDPILFILVCLVGVFTYFAAFKGEVHIWMIPLIILVTVIWYICNWVITAKMIKKSRGDESFFFVKGAIVSSNETELVQGALVATGTELVFYRRKGYLGGVKPIWSCQTSQLESYSLEKVDDKHDGIILTLTGDETKTKIASKTLKNRENEFKAAIGW